MRFLNVVASSTANRRGVQGFDCNYRCSASAPSSLLSMNHQLSSSPTPNSNSLSLLSQLAPTAAHARGMPPPSPTIVPVVSELERDHQRGIFVMHNFVPPNQRGNLDFITQQLRTSPIPPDFVLKTYFTATSSPHVDENSEDWQDLMLWSQPSLLDTLESRPLHLFQWDRTHSYLSDLKAALMASSVTQPSPKFEKQRRWMRSCMQLLQKNMPSLRPHRFPTEVRWVIWKLRRLLAAIPTSSNQAAGHTEDVRLLRFQVDIGVGPWPKLNVLMLNENPDQFFMFLTALSLLATPPSPQPQGQGQLQPQ